MAGQVRQRYLSLLGLLGVPATFLLAFLTPVQAKAFDDRPRAWLVDLEPVHAFADRIWRELGGSLNRYEFWGRWTVLGYLGAMVGLWAFHRVSAPAVPGWRLLVSALGIATGADLIAYWFSGHVIADVGGSIEFFMLPLIVAGTFRYAWVLIRPGKPRWPGGTLLASGIAVIPAMAATNYWPHGVLVPVSAGIAVLGVGAARGVSVRPRLHTGPDAE